MRIRQAIISPLVAISFAGSILAGVAVPVVSAVTSSTPVVAAAPAAPAMLFHA